MKLLWILALAAIAWRIFRGKWPWQALFATERSHAVSSARILLGVRQDASREDIIEAHRKLISMVHPDRGGTNEQVHEANAARDILLAEQARKTEKL